MLGKGCEGGKGTGDEVDMRENGDGRRVLGNVDQNCESSVGSNGWIEKGWIMEEERWRKRKEGKK